MIFEMMPTVLVLEKELVDMELEHVRPLLSSSAPIRSMA